MATAAAVAAASPVATAGAVATAAPVATAAATAVVAAAAPARRPFVTVPGLAAARLPGEYHRSDARDRLGLCLCQQRRGGLCSGLAGL